MLIFPCANDGNTYSQRLLGEFIEIIYEASIISITKLNLILLHNTYLICNLCVSLQRNMPGIEQKIGAFYSVSLGSSIMTEISLMLNVYLLNE